MRKQHSPHREETLQPHFRDNGRLGDNKRPHTLPHLMPGSPAALPIPLADRREQRLPPLLAVMKTARGIAGPNRSQRPPGKQAKVAAVNDSGNSRDRSCQSGFGGAASGQKTATSHIETTRANAMKPLAVRRPPTIAPRPHQAKPQTRRSTHTASRPLTAHGKQSDSVSSKTAHKSHSTKSGFKHPPSFPSLRSGGQGGP